MKTSEHIAEISKALCKFQGALKPAIKDSTNPHFRSKYADLASVWDAIREPLSSNGLSALQLVGTSEGKTSLTTRICHESGEWIESLWEIPIGKNDPQGLGSAISYARRYALAASLGVTQDDDDANAAMPAFSMADSVEKIQSAKSMKDLQNVFADQFKLVSSHKASVEVLVKAKDEMKAKLSAVDDSIDVTPEPKKYVLKRPLTQPQEKKQEEQIESEWK